MTGEDDHSSRASGSGDLSARMRELSGKIDAQRASQRGHARGGSATGSGGYAGIGHALKLSSEFVGGIVVGAGLGWLLDEWLGTTPWGLIGFLMLGFAAGVLNVLRSAGLIQTPEPGKRRVDEDGGDDR
ncbi:AtpZ/AtpI family protein [Amorphus orientalis]|uniref:ATP synthase protein I n=1 Tax=Amorphus orientalis TaxID=649198 RepID=A0AAE3VKA5_9HYPH|nr:AtpZ/AtpI family protein [Amorphus orientalis]MDQ0313944.1 ATP synthase protein I [Amorphus orientalis]